MKTDCKRLMVFWLIFLNEQNEISDWSVLSEKQQEGVLDATIEIDFGKGIPHEKVISKV